MIKRKLRMEMIETRDLIDSKIAREDSSKIAQRVMELEEYKGSEDIFLYCSFRSEVDTRELIEETIKLKGRVYLPKVVSRTKMIFVRITSIDEIAKGFRGIFEPVKNEESSVIPGLIVVPLVAFDRSGTRLGYGGGYYDRTLPLYKGKSLLAAIAFSRQCCDDIPCDENDVKMDAIVTEKEVIRIT